MLKTTGYYRKRSKSQELFNKLSSLITGKYAYLSNTRRSVGIMPFVLDIELRLSLIKEEVWGGFIRMEIWIFISRLSGDLLRTPTKPYSFIGSSLGRIPIDRMSSNLNHDKGLRQSVSVKLSSSPLKSLNNA